MKNFVYFLSTVSPVAKPKLGKSKPDFQMKQLLGPIAELWRFPIEC